MAASDPALYRAVFQWGPEPAILIDVDAARIVDANEATLRLLGLGREEVVGRSPGELIPGVDDGVVAELRAFATQSPAATMVRRLTGFGPIRLLEIHASLVEVADRRLIHAIAHDVTERAAMERHSDRVARLGRLLTELDAHLTDATSEEQVWRMCARRLVNDVGMALAVVGLVEVNGRDMAVQAIECGPALSALGLGAMEGGRRPLDDQMRACLDSGEPYHYRLDGEKSDLIGRAAQALVELDAALVPIRVGRFTVGVIGCAAPEAGFFGGPEMAMLKQVSRRIGVRIGELERSDRELQLAEALMAERERSARFSSAMATIDREIARLARPTEIYEALSRLPVELGICSSAWTGLVVRGRTARQLRIVASAGDIGELAGFSSAESAELGMPPQLEPVETLVVDDVLADGRFKRRWRELEQAGLHSLVAIPLRVGPLIIGGVTYYGRAIGAFGPEQVALLERVAANAGSRLGVMQADERRWHAEKKLAALEGFSPSNRGDGTGPEGQADPTRQR